MRQSIFSQLDPELTGVRVLDLFAGSGTFGLEALSRGAAAALFVEADPATAAALERSLRDLGFRARSTVACADALRVPPLSAARPPRAGRTAALDSERGFDLIFVDPPFALFDGQDGGARVAERVRQLNDSGILAVDGTIVVRSPCHRAFDPGLRVLRERTYGRSRVQFLTRSARLAARGGEHA
jgi:16S rRNA (guanine(966)-N(2))-methyltransferase RsmD